MITKRMTILFLKIFTYLFEYISVSYVSRRIPSVSFGDDSPTSLARNVMKHYRHDYSPDDLTYYAKKKILFNSSLTFLRAPFTSSGATWAFSLFL